MLWELTFGSLESWKAAKEKGEWLFKSEFGGSYQVFNQRPIPEAVVAYCVGDVQCLPYLRQRLHTSKTLQWHNLVLEESKKRVADSQTVGYQPHGRDRALAPWTNEQNRMLDEWNYVPPPIRYEDVDPFEEYYEDDGDDYDWGVDNDYEDWTRCEWQGPPS